ncbi:hypothetical protein EV383_0660 [Pseudonocardia sediminis]|uniref:Uncharacterized protein n=1 Tax=Pseudonocardia sediminis TaxID=1397368 RepID=A0A4Q7USU4_PSEST|nr:hypothetical protein [Pseudonocardia sediminis]RZT83841.1 hypothetical protein EV383_0660 [Pseudonocardia sediminis]
MTSTEQSSIGIRQVTDLHANWSEQGDGEPGKFSFQLILDDGAEEALIRPSAEAAKVLIVEFLAGKSFYWDTQREVLLLRGLK